MKREFLLFLLVAIIVSTVRTQDLKICAQVITCCKLDSGRVYKVATPCVCQDIQGATILSGMNSVCEFAPMAQIDDLIEFFKIKRCSQPLRHFFSE